MEKKRKEHSNKGKSSIYINKPTLNKKFGVMLNDEQYNFVSQQPMTRANYIRALIDKEMYK